MQKVLVKNRFAGYTLRMTDQLLATAAAAFVTSLAAFLLIQKTKNKYKAMQHQDQIAKQIDSLIADTKGKFFSLKFIKKDGTIRTINGKDRYNRLVKGTGSPATDALKAKGYKNAVNRNGESWVSFMPEKVVEFKCGAIHETF
jgi:phage/plasmid primase-like uncharacterized protein